MNIKQTLAILSLGALSLSSVLVTETMAQGKPPEPPFAAIASDLGLSESQVKSCFPKPSGSSSGGRPERPDMNEIATCLKKADGRLSSQEIQTVLKNNEPEMGGKKR